MLLIELTFTSGRFHATPWGRHVNEGIPEWPPSPYRLIRALYDAWCRKKPNLPAEHIEKILSLLALKPPLFSLPSADVAHIRTYQPINKKDATNRQLIFDTFVSLIPESALYIGWPDLVMDKKSSSELAELLSVLNYFGRSESWVNAKLKISDKNIQWNCVPEGENIFLDRAHKIPVACPLCNRYT